MELHRRPVQRQATTSSRTASTPAAAPASASARARSSRCWSTSKTSPHKVNAATAGLPDAKANEVRKQTLSRLEAACTELAAARARRAPLACESVTLYQGGQYFLYKYKRYDDVRLVFAPEQCDRGVRRRSGQLQLPALVPRLQPDARLRERQAGAHARLSAWRAEGPHAGEPVFVAGHPGSTSRLLTVEQLKFQRDVSLPAYIARNSELRGRMIQWAKTGDEPRRIVQETLLSLENSLKVYRGLQSALLDDSAVATTRRKQERELRARVSGDAKLAQQPARRGTTSRRRRHAIARSTIATCTWRAARASTASCSAMRASWCAARPSAPSPTSSGCASTPTPICRRSARAAGGDAGLSRLRTAHAVVLARQDARDARSGRRHRAPAAEQGFARVAREQAGARKRSSPIRPCARRCGKAALLPSKPRRIR